MNANPRKRKMVVPWEAGRRKKRVKMMYESECGRKKRKRWITWKTVRRVQQCVECGE